MLTICRKLLVVPLTLASLLTGATAFAAEGSVRINQVTRKSGGAIYRVYVTNSVSLSRVAVDVLSAKAKIYKVNIITESSTRIPLQRLQNTAVIPAGKTIFSEPINRNERVMIIEVQAESFGAVANLRLRATSNEDVPQMLVVGGSGGVSPQPTPYPTPAPTPIPTPTPPEVVYLAYPFPNYGNQNMTCRSEDDGWEEHGSAHASCSICLEKHSECIETCSVSDTVSYGTGYDVYGRIAKFEGRGGSSYEARFDRQRVCDYYRLSRCESDSGKSESTHSEVISRRSCR